MSFQHLFGPVVSRRLGLSLGVDLVYHKVCSLDCVYCECGKTTEKTCERKSWVSLERVKSELSQYFTENGDPDYITFSGAGEPCLSSDIGRVITHIKETRPGVKVAVLTNATLLHREDVQRDLARADLVVPSLDGVSEEVFRRINRPHADITAQQVCRGIRDFSKIFKGKIHLEIFILQGINDTPEELSLFSQAIREIRPDRVQLNSLDRPGTESSLRPADRDNLARIRKILGSDITEIIARTPSTAKPPRKTEDLEAAVLETIQRRPCTCADLSTMLGADLSTLQVLLEGLLERGTVIARQGARGRFYQTGEKE